MKERGQIILVFAAALVILTAMWAALPREAFYTGDSGVKLVQVENLVSSRYSTVALEYNGNDIDPNSSMSPFQLRPSVYVKDGRNYSVFPILFSFLSSFPYVAFGFAGLYVLPILSGLLCIPLAYAIARHFMPHRFAMLAAALALFGTPMFFYSLTFWEHAPASCLFLASVWLFMRSARNRPAVVVSGFLLGMCAWLRTEMLVLALIAGVAGMVSLGRPRAIVAWMSGAALSVFGLLAMNRSIHGEWLGHVTRNARMGGMDGLCGSVPVRMSHLWTSLFGLNAPQSFSAVGTGGPQTGVAVKSSGSLELLAFGAVAGILCMSVMAFVVEYRRTRQEHHHGARPQGSWVLAGWAVLFLALAAAVGIYVSTLSQDRAPLVTVLKSGGLFTFSPFLAMALAWPWQGTARNQVRRGYLWLLGTSLAFIIVMPLLAPNDGGIRYGARYLLPVMPLLVILAVAVFHEFINGPGRRVFVVLMAALVMMSLLIEARGYQVLHRKKAFGRDLTATLMASSSQRVAALFWWIPFEMPRVILDRKVHMVFTLNALETLLASAKEAGDGTVDVVLPGRIDSLPRIEGTAVVGRKEVGAPFDTYFQVTIFTLAFR